MELLTPRCGPGADVFGDKFEYLDNDTGIAVRDPGQSHTLQALQVLSKPAGQPITATIREQFIAKMKSPAARQNCIAKRTPNETGPVETYEVVATGAYARQPRFHRQDDSSDDPCPGLNTNDAYAIAFVFVGQDSRTKYLLYKSEDALPFDINSIRFLPTDSGVQTAGNSPKPDGSALQKMGGAAAAPAESTSAPAREAVPRSGVWTYAQKINVHDVSPDAATAATLNFLTGAEPKTSTFYLGCNGAAPGGPRVELRAAFPATPGYGPGQTGQYGSLLISKSKHDVTFSLVNAGALSFLALPLTAADLALMANEDKIEPGALTVIFGVAFGKATVTADLPTNNAALESVINACHVSLPPR